MEHFDRNTRPGYLGMNGVKLTIRSDEHGMPIEHDIKVETVPVRRHAGRDALRGAGLGFESRSRMLGRQSPADERVTNYDGTIDF